MYSGGFAYLLIYENKAIHSSRMVYSAGVRFRLTRQYPIAMELGGRIEMLLIVGNITCQEHS